MTSRDSWAKAPDYRDQPQVVARLRAATAADREHYISGGMRPVTCHDCGTCVLVGKNSPKHTSVQWTSDSRKCPELAAGGGHPGAALVDGCSRLHASIDRAVRQGVLEVPADDAPQEGR